MNINSIISISRTELLRPNVGCISLENFSRPFDTMEATLLAFIHSSFQRSAFDSLSLALQAFPSSSIHVPRLLHRDQQHSSGGLPSVIHTHWSLQQSQRHRFIISIVKHHSTIQHSSSSIRQHFQSLFFASSFFFVSIIKSS